MAKLRRRDPQFAIGDVGGGMLKAAQGALHFTFGFFTPLVGGPYNFAAPQADATVTDAGIDGAAISAATGTSEVDMASPRASISSSTASWRSGVGLLTVAILPASRYVRSMFESGQN
jgi:hypothetical protein